MHSDFHPTHETLAYFNRIVENFAPNQDIINKVEAINQRTIAETAEIYENRQKMMAALEQTAQNTGEANAQLTVMVSQQMEHIQLLQEANQTLKQQMEIQRSQLQILQDIFVSDEDSVVVEKEIMRLIAEQINEKHPLWEYAKDKGGDALIAYGPVLFEAFKCFLASKGITL